MKLNYSGASDNALDMHSKVYTQMVNPYAMDAHSLVYIVACTYCYLHNSKLCKCIFITAEMDRMMLAIPLRTDKQNMHSLKYTILFQP